jgi:hypothetical protein
MWILLLLPCLSWAHTMVSIEKPQGHYGQRSLISFNCDHTCEVSEQKKETLRASTSSLKLKALVDSFPKSEKLFPVPAKELRGFSIRSLIRVKSGKQDFSIAIGLPSDYPNSERVKYHAILRKIENLRRRGEIVLRIKK